MSVVGRSGGKHYGGDRLTAWLSRYGGARLIAAERAKGPGSLPVAAGTRRRSIAVAAAIGTAGGRPGTAPEHSTAGDRLVARCGLRGIRLFDAVVSDARSGQRAGADSVSITASSSRSLSMCSFAWCWQKSNSPPAGRTARTRAAAPQRSQRSTAVSGVLVRVPGMTPPSWLPAHRPFTWCGARGHSAGSLPLLPSSGMTTLSDVRDGGFVPASESMCFP